MVSFTFPLSVHANAGEGVDGLESTACPPLELVKLITNSSMDDSQTIKYAYVDSTNRDLTLFPSGNAYTLFLTNPIKSIVRIDLVAAKVPNTMYNITDGKNFLTINSQNVSIAPGYYSADALADALVNASGDALAMDFSCSEGKYIFSNVSSSFTLKANTLEAQKTLGLTSVTSAPASENPVYALDPTYGPLQIAKSTRIIDLSTNEYVFLDIQEFRSTSILDAKKLVGGTTEGSSMRSSFGMIPLDVPGGSIKNFKETSDYKQYVEYDYPIVKLDRLTVRWVDKKGQMISFNGFENNAFTLRFRCVYNKPEPELPPVPAFDLKRYLETVVPPPPPPKKTAWGRWFLILIICVLGVLLIKRTRVAPINEQPL
jgi:hypothetical protein